MLALSRQWQTPHLVSKMLSYSKLSSEMTSTSLFVGIGTKKFFDGIANGIVRSVKEGASTTIVFSGNAGSSGRGYLHGIPTASASRLRPLLLQELTSRSITGVASPNLASAVSKTADTLKEDAEIIVPVVTGVANGTGILSAGGIILSPSSSFAIISQEMIAQGVHDIGGPFLSEASRRIADAVATALSKYLLTLSCSIPVTGGSPSSGTSSVTLTGRYII